MNSNGGGSYTWTLHNGVEFPLVGLGTYELTPEVVGGSCVAAVEKGYRLVDTAAAYNNEAAIGAILPELEVITTAQAANSAPGDANLDGIESVKWVSDAQIVQNKQQVPIPSPHTAEDKLPIFITTKVPPSKFGREKATACVEASLKALQRSRVDLVLLHWPGVSEMDPQDEKMFPIRYETWQAMEDLYAEGKVRSIGVSNYMAHQMKGLLDNIAERKAKGDKNATIPMVNQFEFHPLCQPAADLVKICRDNKIIMTSYSTLGSAKGKEEVLNNVTLKKIAEKHQKTTAQICLRWALQRNATVIPRSATADRVRQNFEVFNFSLSDSEMKEIKDVDAQKRFCWDPTKLI